MRQDLLSMLGQQASIREGAVSSLENPIKQDELAMAIRRWHTRAFRKAEDVWWKGWNGLLDVEELGRLAGEAQFGMDYYDLWTQSQRGGTSTVLLSKNSRVRSSRKNRGNVYLLSRSWR
ncbi:hypothetical protein CSUI_007490 [Cystoisospora suis]|uniref:Uncharacterized protein n=1 Tax=Cystoisospora suis TaxID=483139 RepID=A0A2C6KQA0_9APIC|nr:hypothetical protein CSUI_007490 [Cystoisospora suis]